MPASTECLPRDVPDGLVTPAAYCRADFDVICARIGAHQTVRYITYSKKLEKPKERYRCVGLKLSNEKFATLLKMDREKYFEIWLQREGYGYHLSEIEEVRRFLNVDKFELLRLNNALKWLQPQDAEPVDLPIMTMSIANSEPWHSVLHLS